MEGGAGFCLGVRAGGVITKTGHRGGVEGYCSEEGSLILKRELSR